MDLSLFASGFEALLRADVLIALLVGSVGGVLIGAVPGIGPAVAIAILLPVTFSLDPIVGITLLLGIYGSSMFGGAIPAILINTPGTAVNALTTYDGYPMTKRNEAGKGLAIAYSASLFGGLFSIIALLALAPLIAKVAPLFGSRDILMAAILGLVLVTISHRGQALAAGMMVCFGFFINTIGLEPVKYSTRYTFDQRWLNSGVDLIVVLLGLFALSQAFMLLAGKDDTEKPPKAKSEFKAGIAAIGRNKRVATTSSFFGVIMGIIPGCGEFLAQFFSYSVAQRLSKTPERFGRGSEEGLIASESANNAVPAAAMVPLLALGIPGEALTAMMLSVFYVHNVIPGPALFDTQPEFLYSLFLALIAVNLLVFLFLYLTARYLVRVVEVPNRFLGITILILSFVGVYSLRNSIVDCIICAGFGLLGYLLKRLSLPLIPIILGMVLGGIIEQKFRASLIRVDTLWDFINRPVSGTLFAIIVFALVVHIISLIRSNRHPGE